MLFSKETSDIIKPSFGETGKRLNGGAESVHKRSKKLEITYLRLKKERDTEYLTIVGSQFTREYTDTFDVHHNYFNGSYVPFLPQGIAIIS